MTRMFAALAAAFFVASCSGGGYGGAVSQPPPPPPVAPLDFADPGMAVIKVRAGVDGMTLLEEKATSILETGPQRRITLLDGAGAVRARY